MSVLASIRSNFCSSLLVLFSVVFSSIAYSDMVDKTGMQAWEVCAMCHNANGISRMAKFPKLAGQKAAYIEQQVHAFRAGKRQNDGGQMQSIVGEVSAEEIPGIAAYFSTLPQDTSIEVPVQDLSEQDRQHLSQGHVLFNSGREAIPACAQCHTNAASTAPWIDGQHALYLKKQIKDFYSGEREADCPLASSLPDKPQTLSKEHLQTLTDKEIEALSFYLSHLKLERKR